MGIGGVQRPVAVTAEQFVDIRIVVIRFGLEIAAVGSFGINLENGEIPFSLVLDEEE